VTDDNDNPIDESDCELLIDSACEYTYLGAAVGAAVGSAMGLADGAAVGSAAVLVKDSSAKG
jgi:hypothetical protein